ncbi:MAG TPA: CBS domain-containing protein [Thermoanaerobaculia bacterium]|nr:CBS domain-containing protein [Thermoanaerobaculia bacterium]
MKQISELIEGHPLILAQSSDNVRDVARKMSERNIGAIAVLDAGKLVGIFSERDLMTRVVVPGLNPDSTPVSNVMTKAIVAAAPEEEIDSALQKMQSQGCRHLPVVDDGRLMGMLSLRDLLKVDDDNHRARASFLNELVTYSPDYDS